MINFFTSFYQGNLLIDKKKFIAINYLKGWFILDLLSVLPILIIINPYLYFTLDNNISNYNLLEYYNYFRFTTNKSKVLSYVRIIQVIRFLRLLRIFRLKGYIIKVIITYF